MQIVAMGGWAERPLQDFVLGLTGAARPKLLYVPTADREDARPTLSIYELLGDRAEVSHLHFFPWPPADLRQRALASDLIWVGGGNTANMLAVWRAHGFDEVLREAWEAGVVLTGWSAGAICWFEDGVTDSFGPQLDRLGDGLGFLPGSFLPALRRRGAAPARLPGARAGRHAGRHRLRRRHGGALRRRRAARGRRVGPRVSRLPRRRGADRRVSLRESWDEQAEDWALFARTPGHDEAHERLNFPAFCELLPPPGRSTLDLGCGEGRVGVVLERLGHRVVGIDSSPRMVELARERHQAVVADATALPFEDGAFDLVVAYMSLMNMDDLDAAVREASRVLEPGSRLCAAVLHPIFAAGEWRDKEDEESPFVIPGYLDAPTKVWTSDRDGVRVTFHDRVIPISVYGGALEQAGLPIESLRESQPSDALVRDVPSAAWLRRVPLFLHLRAVKR